MKGTFEYNCTCNRKDTKKTRNNHCLLCLFRALGERLDNA